MPVTAPVLASVCTQGQLSVTMMTMLALSFQHRTLCSCSPAVGLPSHLHQGISRILEILGFKDLRTAPAASLDAMRGCHNTPTQHCAGDRA